ncbi:MAG TPA: metallophosphoesterase [Gemmatimonadaceae bacterium]|nr:metallophosphoesterase [Gemmatimonadaceae bacterium]
MTAGIDRRPIIRDRRLARTRRTLELTLDRVFRPHDWAATLSYYAGLQGRLRVETTTLSVPRPADAAPRPPLRIAFASDFHAGPTTSARALERAAQALAELEPDLLLLGGDFVSVRADDIERLAPLLERIPARLGKLGVLGNHDLRANHPRVSAALERAGVELITNRWVSLPAPFDDLTICGLDDSRHGDPRADTAMDGAPGRRIVLMHAPEALRQIGDREFDLALCGHTHGGQVVLPWGKPVFIPPGALNHRYYAGEYTVGPRGTRRLLVSHGVGCSTLPVRLFAAPQVHLCLIV